MEPSSPKPTTIDAYIARFPEDVRERLAAVRAAVRSAAPDATESVSYSMPTFSQHGVLVYFTAAKNHIGFYPTSDGLAAFQSELAVYPQSKMMVRFPFDQPLPLELIRRIIASRVAENTKRATAEARTTSKGKPKAM